MMRISLFIFLSCLPVMAFAAENKGENIPLEITADKALEWNQTDKTYIARGKAIATQGDVTVKADLLTAKYAGANGNNSDIYLLTAEGHVTLISGTDVATGDKAVYDLTTGQAVLSGARPKIVQKEKNTLEADNIIIWTQTDKRKGSVGTLDHAEAVGHVMITSGPQTATGDKATYVAATNIVEILGTVKINQGNNILEGDKAEVNLTTRVSKMSGEGQSKRVKGVFYTSANKKN